MTEVSIDSLNDRLMKLESEVSNLKNLLTGPNQKEAAIRDRVKVSINEFIRTMNVQNDVQRTLIIAYWLDYLEKVETFSVSDLEEGFRSARLSVPKNINDKVNLNIKNGHLAVNKGKKNGKKTWYVTNTGAEFVENTLKKVSQE